MTLTNPDNAPPATGARPALSRGAAALLTSGLIVLVATAAAGRLYWTPDPPRAAAPAQEPAQAPNVWLASLAPATPVRFAIESHAEAPLSVVRMSGDSRTDATRHTAPPADPAPDAQAPQVWLASLVQPTPVRFADESHAEAPLLRAPRRISTQPHDDPAQMHRPAPRSASPAGPEGQATAPVVIASVPPVTPPHRPHREQGTIATPAIPQAVLAAPQAESDATGLARSLLPRARPEAIVQLASLTPSPAAAPSAMTAALQVLPPLATASADRCDASLARAIPGRPSGAEGGQRAIARLAASAGSNRDAAIAQAIIAGNVPQFLRTLVPVTLTGTGADGRAARITLCVMPDYLALGSDSDFVRTPLGLPAANRIAERFDMVLPTTRMVDAIHAQARVQLRPSPMTPGPQMASTDYFLRHNATLEGQRHSAGAPLGALVSGHKKDLVLSNRLERNPGRVAIYGWHQASGQPIQPLSTVHGASYADYSHGIRLISRTAYINGRAVDLRDLLGDSRYAGLISNEGPIASRLMLAALR